MLLLAVRTRASEITITVTGTLTGAEDYLGIFGMGRLIPAGTPFSLIYTFDDSKGRGIHLNRCPNSGSGISGSRQLSPASATLTIGGKSYVFGRRPDANSSTWRSIATACSRSEIGIDVTEGESPLLSQVNTGLVPAQGVHSLTQEADWRSAVTLTRFYARNMSNSFVINRPGNYATGTKGYLSVSAVSISGPKPMSAAPVPGPATAPQAVPKTGSAVPNKVASEQAPASQPASSKGPEISRIYVLTTTNGTNLSTYTVDGQHSDPSINLGLMYCDGVAVDAEGKIYVSNSGPRNNVMIFEPNGTRATSSLNLGIGALGVKVDGSGRIFVLGAAGGKGVVKSFTESGSGAGPTINTGIMATGGLALDAAGRIYVADQGYDKVYIYDPNGNLLHSIVKSGMNTPRSVAVGPDGKIYVGNFLNVTTYLPSGQRTSPTISQQNTEGGLDTITGLAVDLRGRIYVGGSSGRVGIYNPDGTLVRPLIQTRRGIEGIAIH